MGAGACSSARARGHLATHMGCRDGGGRGQQQRGRAQCVAQGVRIGVCVGGLQLQRRRHQVHGNGGMGTQGVQVVDQQGGACWGGKKGRLGCAQAGCGRPRCCVSGCGLSLSLAAVSLRLLLLLLL